MIAISFSVPSGAPERAHEGASEQSVTQGLS